MDTSDLTDPAVMLALGDSHSVATRAGRVEQVLQRVIGKFSNPACKVIVTRYYQILSEAIIVVPSHNLIRERVSLWALRSHQAMARRELDKMDLASWPRVQAGRDSYST